MSLHTLADTLAAKGRGGDSVLVHMSPGEVHGLQTLAMAHGGSLTINPETGLPEANFLKSILPMLAGGALTVLSGGALSPLMSAAIVGGGTALATKNLGQGLMAGLGAFGGASFGNALTSMGSQLAGAVGSDLASATGPAANIDKFKMGLGAAIKTPEALMYNMGGNWSDVAKAGGMAAAPLLAGTFNKPASMPQTITQQPALIRPYKVEWKETPADQLGPMTSRERTYGRWETTPLEPYPASESNQRAMQQYAQSQQQQPPQYFASGGLSAIERNPYYTMSGDSADVYKYLMGEPGAQRPRYAVEPPATKPAGEPTAAAAAKPAETLPPYAYYTGTGEGSGGNEIGPAVDLGGLTGIDFGGLFGGLFGGANTGASTGASEGANEGGNSEGDGGANIAHGGSIGYAHGGRLLTGPGDGVSDSIPASIDNKAPAKLATGEFVFDARTVSEIGNGDTRSGAKKLYQVMDAIHRARAHAKRGEPSGADQHLRSLVA